MEKSLTISVGMVDSTTILTGNPMSLSSRDSSTAVMKSHASSMVTFTSALRVTLNTYAPSTSRVGNRAEMCVSIMSSSITMTSPLELGTWTNLGRVPTGTLTLAYSLSPAAFTSFAAMFSELLDMKGKGWETSSARGVRRAWTLSW